MKIFKMNHKNQVSVLMAVAVAGLVGCETSPPKPVAQQAVVKCLVPKIAALPETKESQEKGGVVIGIVPALYKAARRDTRVMEPAQPPVEIFVIANPHAGQVYVHESVTPKLVAEPGRLEFTVRVNNKLDRVFRGQGSVVQFNVGGKLIPFDQTNYRDFLNGIVPPRNETEFKIYGPTLDALPQTGTIGIFLYDVVTATDVKGSVTEKQNFEWYFNCTMQDSQQSVEASHGDRWITQAEYQEYSRKAMLEQQQRMMREIRSATPLQVPQ